MAGAGADAAPVRYLAAKQQQAVWQHRYWEHMLRDGNDFIRHVEYIHFNPVKHGWAQMVRDWPYSTFHRWVERGVYPLDWAGSDKAELDTGERLD